MKTSRRICILLPDLAGGGAERVNLDLACEFIRLGYKVEFVLLRAHGVLLAETQASFLVTDLGCSRIRQLPFRLACYLRQKRPDAIIAAMWPMTGIAALVTRLVSPKTRVLVSEHNDFRHAPHIKGIGRRVLSIFGALIYAMAHQVVAVSQGVAESLSVMAGVSRERIEVIYNPIRPAQSGSINMEDQNNLQAWLNAPLRLIAIGSLKQQKRFDISLRAFAEIRKESDVHLLILGEGQLRDQLEADAIGLGISDALHMPGFRNNVHSFLEHAHCFVLSSDYEGFGNVIVEALSVGVPIVSTDCQSGPREILSDGRFGRLVPVGDSHALARAVEEVLQQTMDDEKYKNSLIERARDFRPEVAARKYLDAMFPQKKNKQDQR